MTSESKKCQALSARQRLEDQYKAEHARMHQAASAPVTAPVAEQRTAEDEAHWNKLVENYGK